MKIRLFFFSLFCSILFKLDGESKWALAHKYPQQLFALEIVVKACRSVVKAENTSHSFKAAYLRAKCLLYNSRRNFIQFSLSRQFSAEYEILR